MASRLTVIFYIVLCLEAGLFLTVLPWWQPWGASGWGDNYFLVLAAQKLGFIGLQRVVASGWVRGAVTGVGLLNLSMAFWEIFHFRETVRRLQGADGRAVTPTQAMDAPTQNTNAPAQSVDAHTRDEAEATKQDSSAQS